MNRVIWTLVLALTVVAPAAAGAPGGRAYLQMYPNYNRGARWFNANVPWHAPYAHHTYRQPTALIVPPIANMQTSYSWGVGRTRMVPIYHQFTRPYVAPGAGGTASAAPLWPSSTLQYGVYYARGAW
jgi:hypothetical protein